MKNAHSPAHSYRLLEMLAVSLILLLTVLIFNLIRLERLNYGVNEHTSNGWVFRSKDKEMKGEENLKGDKAYSALTILKSFAEKHSEDGETNTSYYASYGTGGTDVSLVYNDAAATYNLFGTFDGRVNEFRIRNNKVYEYSGIALREANINNSKFTTELIDSVDLSNYKSFIENLVLDTVGEVPEELNETGAGQSNLSYRVEKFTYDSENEMYKLRIIMGDKQCLEQYTESKDVNDSVACDDILHDEWTFDETGNKGSHAFGAIKSDGYVVEYLGSF